ncbi:MAG: type II toxin-antitoxin system MqsA family antitoxin [Gammaproteobacteria bacterium]|nr:type II toxin-antitoxin system MqsA family antitoxin [Gammaproteobacteria bacterium]
MTKIASPPTVLSSLPGPTWCELCETTNLRAELVRDPFIYGAGEEAVELSADVRVHTCSNCGDSYTGPDAEVAYHEAVCRHLGILTPAEIRATREGYGFTRAEFAHLTGFGKATLGRWERGEVTQNRSADRYLRLLQDPKVMRRLRVLVEPDSSGLPTPVRSPSPTFFLPDSSQQDIRKDFERWTPGTWEPSLGFHPGVSAAA